MSAARLTKPNHQTTRHADHPWLPVAPRVDAAVAGVIAGVVEGVAAAVAGALASPGTPPPTSGARGSVTAANLTTLADHPDVAAGPTLVWAGPAVVLWCLSDVVLS